MSTSSPLASAASSTSLVMPAPRAATPATTPATAPATTVRVPFSPSSTPPKLTVFSAVSSCLTPSSSTCSPVSLLSCPISSSLPWVVCSSTPILPSVSVSRFNRISSSWASRLLAPFSAATRSYSERTASTFDFCSSSAVLSVLMRISSPLAWFPQSPSCAALARKLLSNTRISRLICAMPDLKSVVSRLIFLCRSSAMMQSFTTNPPGQSVSACQNPPPSGQSGSQTAAGSQSQFRQWPPAATQTPAPG